MASREIETIVLSQIKTRQISDGDIESVAKLLGAGLGYPQKYFLRVFDVLSKHSTPKDFPRYGYILENEGIIVGAIILIFSMTGAGHLIRCHVTSWYVEPRFRPYATLFILKGLRYSNVTYINTSARSGTLPIIQAQGFKQYSAGQFVAMPILQWRPWLNECAEIMPGDMVPNVPFNPQERKLLADHAEYGCISLWAVRPEGAHPFIFHQRFFRGIIPGVQLSFCRSINDFVRFARPLASYLASRGRFVVRVDANGPIPGLIGKFVEGMEPRFYKGKKPRLGDLTYTQTVMCPSVRRRFRLTRPMCRVSNVWQYWRR